MERTQEEMKFLGVIGMLREGHKIMAPNRKLLNEITLAFILPLSIIYLAEIDISTLLHFGMTLGVAGNPNTWVSYILFKLAYYTLLVIFSLLSTSAVVYSIACIYANRNISFNKLIPVVPKVWKRLIITFILTYGLAFIYIFIVVLTLTLSLSIGGTTSLLIFFVLLFVYIIGFVYLTIVWQLASVITVLEDSTGVMAIKKSYNLIKGKFWVALAIFLQLNVLVGVIELVYYVYVVNQNLWYIWNRVLVRIVCLVLLVPIFLYGLVLQTIIYFVCKSHHNETIDKPAMSNHLGAYERLNDPNEVPMGQV